MFTFIIFIAAWAFSAAKKPPFWEKAETARWLVHENVYGTISTTSVHLNGQAWGQPKSFADGSSSNSTGNLYFYDSELDTSIQVCIKFVMPYYKSPYCKICVQNM